MRASAIGILAIWVAAFSGAVPAVVAGKGAALRLQGSVEPVRSHPVIVPRLTGSGTGTLVIVHLVKPGTRVKRGELLIEFDRQAQIKTAHDRQAEYRDFVEQINRKRGEQLTASAHGEAELKTAENAVKSAELEVQKTEIVPPITAEQNRLSLDEARAKASQLRKTFELRRKLDVADIRALEIQRDRALNAWKHAESNAEKMRVVSPIDGMVVLKSTWKNGTMGEVQEGEEVRSGLGIMDVIDSSAMQVRARVNQADVSALRVGQAARITLDSYPGRAFDGRLEQLSQIGSISTMSNRVRTFLAVFSIDGSDPHLMPDLAAAIDMAEDSR
ncbi:MAG TPA: efflux RND transporter periplasmic adaptor subunit [Vicinamibacterales bacterium]|jgi:HlyD family secretion protein|nr:efflux RND transporter periplasmic adaptor subunit [Vicinamibacterales bacterium]